MLLIVIGVLIVLMPDLLALMVASALIIIGVQWLINAYTWRQRRPTTCVRVFEREGWL
jgi:hypothetical protein